MSVQKKTKSLEEFDVELANLHLRGQWIYDALLERTIGGPKPAGVPYLWKWETMYPLLLESREVLPESFTARRHLGFINPGLERGGTTHTLHMGLQMVRPGELAWSHRHTIGAIRFGITGSQKLFTVVDGEVCPMESYDLVLTPRWSWHDHHNETNEDMIWLDVLDVPLILATNTMFYEHYPVASQQARRPNEGEYIQARAGTLRPTWERHKVDHLPLRYPWKEAETQLMRMAHLEGNPYEGISLEYVNPITGGPTLPTLSCWLQMLRPGEQTKSHRRTSSAVYFVVRGEGTTVVGDTELNWGQHDSFCVPNWSWHHHVNRSKSGEAILFAVHDIPILQSLSLYFEEPENSLQMKPFPAVPAMPRSATNGP
jgi:1-hydroxy-2-naphthoate dioxygenase